MLHTASQAAAAQILVHLHYGFFRSFVYLAFAQERAEEGARFYAEAVCRQVGNVFGKESVDRVFPRVDGL